MKLCGKCYGDVVYRDGMCWVCWEREGKDATRVDGG